MHLGSDRGGNTAATLLSLVQSCKNLGNEPFAYLRDVLERVSTHPDIPDSALALTPRTPRREMPSNRQSIHPHARGAGTSAERPYSIC